MNDNDKQYAKSVISIILSWGFPAVFAILGIVLMGVSSTIAHNDHKTEPLCMGLGAFIAVVGCLMWGFIQMRNSDNKVRDAKIIELQNEVLDLKAEIKELTNQVADLTAQIATLKSELDRKQAKIDKLQKDCMETKKIEK